MIATMIVKHVSTATKTQRASVVDQPQSIAGRAMNSTTGWRSVISKRPIAKPNRSGFQAIRFVGTEGFVTQSLYSLEAQSGQRSATSSHSVRAT
jgi:hypothetical protein